ncbi:MAG: tetratricopeptide repeat protein [Actinomycetota bacterium]
MATVEEHASRAILTPDQRLRIFVSSTLNELAEERKKAADAINNLRLHPVMFELGARPHPPSEVYRSYLEQSQVFVGIYWQSYGWIAPGMHISGLEDEYLLSAGKPRLIYVKEPAPEREPALERMLAAIRTDGGMSYKTFSDAEELGRLLANDLAIMLTERFTSILDGAGDGSVTTFATPQVPITQTSFVGREQDVSAVLNLLRDPQVWLVTLWGSGGIGKTRLALEIGRRAREDFPDGVAVVWLDSIDDPHLVTQAIAATLDVRDPPGGSLLGAIADRLADKKMLLVLDNFEHVISAAPLVADLLALPGETKCLVTSRALLRIRGEHAFEVRPLVVPGAETPDPESLAEVGSVALFVDRAKSVAPSFSLSVENAAAVAEISRRLEGVPLALELAAARVRMLSPQAMVERLTPRLDLLRRGPRDMPERQRTLRDTLRWSFELLTEEEQLALERMSIFAGGASLEAAAKVLGFESVDDAIEVLASLVDNSLLHRVEPGGSEPAFRTLEMIGEYGRERLSAHGRFEETKDRHAAYFLELATKGANELFSPAGPRWYDVLEREHENMQAALAWFIESGRIDDGFRLAIDLQWFWWIRGHLSTADHWLTKLLALPGGSPRARGLAMLGAGQMAGNLDDAARGRRILRDSLGTLQEAGDDRDVAWARAHLGIILSQLGEKHEAAALERQALEVFYETDDWLGQCTSNTALATLYAERGDYEATDRHLQRSLAARRELGDPWGTGFVLNALGVIHIRQGNPDEAEEYLTEALPLLRRVGSKEHIARCLDSLGQVAALEGRWGEAECLYREALDIYREIGMRGRVALERAHLARAALVRGAQREAVGLYRTAFELAREVGEPRSMAVSIEGLALMLSEHGRAAAAAKLLGVADGIRDRNGIPRLGPFAQREAEQIRSSNEALAPEPFEGSRIEGRDMSELEQGAMVLSTADSLIATEREQTR